MAGEWRGGADVVAAGVDILIRRGRVVVRVAVLVPGELVVRTVDFGAIATMPLFLAKASLEHAPAVVFAAPDTDGVARLIYGVSMLQAQQWHYI